MQNLSQLKNSQTQHQYETKGGIHITRTQKILEPTNATTRILNQVDDFKGALFSSRYEYPGRYSRWDVGFIHPPLEIRATGREYSIEALNTRGELLLDLVYKNIRHHPDLHSLEYKKNQIKGTIIDAESGLPEELRSQRPSIFTLVRSIKEIFKSDQDSFLGLYGSFGYELVFQLEPTNRIQDREKNETDLVLYLPDELVVVDHQSNQAYELSYEFQFEGRKTDYNSRYTPKTDVQKMGSDGLKTYEPGHYANLVHKARKTFKRGDMFEVVPSQTLYERCESKPSEVFDRLQQINPSPYGFIINLGDEFLVGSSPEMYVRVEGNRIETCPISGTIKRGENAMEDAEQIRELLNSKKDEEELTMCTDVDRNDKSRICIPGSVNVIGRRQIELYSHLIHTVDHVEGYLRPEFDALDAFLTHMWAVTVTGAPKKAAIQWIEEHEESPRGWYGGAVGWFSFNGDLNTGLTLRTIRLKNKVAEVRIGATLLYDSVPEAEEQETLTKAAGLLKAIQNPLKKEIQSDTILTGLSKKVLIVDHEDSFVHTLANYFKQTGAEVVTYRLSKAQELLNSGVGFDLVVLSPGPGTPTRFKLSDTIQLCLDHQIPIFGVCLGFQGIVEYFGGELGFLDYPQHGKSTFINQTNPCFLFEGIPDRFKSTLYHSIYVSDIPESIRLTGQSDDKIPMVIQHRYLPISAVQFHPESVGSSAGNIGIHIIHNVMKQLTCSTKKQLV